MRKGPPGAGAPLNGLTPIELSMFNEGLQRAIQLEALCDDCSDLTLGAFVDPAQAKRVTKTNSAGLGTRFNGDQCLGCHNQPVLRGSGGFMEPDPQDFAGAAAKAGESHVRSFPASQAPIREVRFMKKPDGSPDGGVHQLFTIVGRSDIFPAGQQNTCTAEVLPSTDFESELKKGNLRFRIPTPLLGLGILDGIPDREILGRNEVTAALRQELGILGVPNRSGIDGTITRFGWKAQNKLDEFPEADL